VFKHGSQLANDASVIGLIVQARRVEEGDHVQVDIVQGVLGHEERSVCHLGSTATHKEDAAAGSDYEDGHGDHPLVGFAHLLDSGEHLGSQ